MKRPDIRKESKLINHLIPWPESYGWEEERFSRPLSEWEFNEIEHVLKLLSDEQNKLSQNWNPNTDTDTEIDLRYCLRMLATENKFRLEIEKTLRECEYEIDVVAIKFKLKNGRWPFEDEIR